MLAPRLGCLLALLTVSSAHTQRWSRQIGPQNSAEFNDWVPLIRPIQERSFSELEPSLYSVSNTKRQAVAEPRILSEPSYQPLPRPGFGQETGFPQRNFFGISGLANRQLYLQSVPSVPSAPQNFLTDQGFGQQNIRFGLSPTNFPLNQGFVSQQLPFESMQSLKRPVNPVKFEEFPHIPALSPQAKPFVSQVPKKVETSKFVDGYRVDNATELKRKPQSLQKLKYENPEKVPRTEPIPSAQIPNKAKSEREEVQLLYVPLESLNDRRFNFRTPQLPAALTNEVPPQRPAVEFTKPIPRPIDSFSLNQDIFNNFNAFREFDKTTTFSTAATPFPKFSSASTQYPTTARPVHSTQKHRKLKPHQPPLAIFLAQDVRKGYQVKVGDVISALKNANTIAVLDTVNPATAPEVFIGPSSMNPPENFAKFDLPYLSHISHTEKKVKQLPFFVAPLSYHTPQGFAKIPFPAPHVGSVVINANQIRDTTTTVTPTPENRAPSSPDYNPSSYSTIPPYQYRQETRPATTKPNVSFFSTAAPKTNPPTNYQSNYYSFEPQAVNTIRPTSQQPPTSSRTSPNTYNNQYNKIRFEYQEPGIQSDYNYREAVNQYNAAKETPFTTTTVSTTPKASTYANLLETHNPYSINQAFHFSTPSDYTLAEENYPSPGGATPPPTSLSLPVGPSSQKSTEDKGSFSSPDYLQNYSNEQHYQTDVSKSKYHNFQFSEPTAKPEVSTVNASVNTENTDYTRNTNNVQQTVAPQQETFVTNEQGRYESDVVSTSEPYLYTQYNYESERGSKTYQNTVSQTSTASSTTSTTTSTSTTTRRPTRGRPRYTTSKPDTTTDVTTKFTVTRRPLRERRPLPPRNKYEPTKTSAERGTKRPFEAGDRTTKKPSDSNENTSKYIRNRTRGRVHYKNNTEDTDDLNDRRKQNKKEDDLAYQRDVLHQNYPVTIQERASTSDIEAITESLPRISSTNGLENYPDNANAYTHDKAAYSQQLSQSELKEETAADAAKTNFDPEDTSMYLSNDNYNYQSRSSYAPVDAISSFGETSPEQEIKLTTPLPNQENVYESASPSLPSSPSSPSLPSSPLSLSSTTAAPRITTEHTLSVDLIKQESPAIEDNIFLKTDTTITKAGNSKEKDEDENVVQTTASYNRVRVRPGVIRQFHQASTTDASRSTYDRRPSQAVTRPTQAVTYRPAYERRRTTMRIEEIGEDLKTKQVHARPEVQDIRHPVYRPEPTESVTSPSTPETTTKRGAFRRRRPTYTTTSTETSSTKQASSEVRSRFRGRRPTTEKAVETTTSETQTEPTATTQKSTTYSRFFNRQRLNKFKQSKETADQDTNYSINVPKYVEPETEVWPPILPNDSFKPFNPNDIVYDKPIAKDHDGYSEIITARNEYDNVLISVTPATNNRDETEKKIPDIPPTLEALVEQSKATTADRSSEAMSNFESILEEVMKNLEEQDKDEYTTKDKVTKHKGGEIGEIPPDWTNTNDNSTQTLAVEEGQVSTTGAETQESGRKRGFWKKVKVRPVTEVIEAAETQYHPATVNRNGFVMTLSKTVHDKNGEYQKPKAAATTYKPAYSFINDLLNAADASEEDITMFDISKISKNIKANEIKISTETDKATESLNEVDKAKEKIENVRENDYPDYLDIGGSSDNKPEQTTTTEAPNPTFIEKDDNFSLMDYLFGISGEDETKTTTDKLPNDFKQDNANDLTVAEQKKNDVTTTVAEQKKNDVTTTVAEQKKNDVTTTVAEQKKNEITTTETSFIPDEIHSLPNEISGEAAEYESKKLSATDKPQNNENTTVTANNFFADSSSESSGLINPDSEVVSTSKSTEVSHETEICFRGKCIKTSKDFLS